MGGRGGGGGERGGGGGVCVFFFFFFSSRRRHTRLQGDWSSDVCSSDLVLMVFCLGTEVSNDSLFINGWFHWFSVKELKVPIVNYLEMGGSIIFLFNI